MAACKRLIKGGADLAIRASRGINAGSSLDKIVRSRGSCNTYGSLSSNSSDYRLDYRQISQLANTVRKEVNLVDTLALARSLEAKGIPPKHAEAVTSAMTLVLDDSFHKISEDLISKAEMEIMVVAQEANLSNFKTEVKSSQNLHFALVQRAIEKLRSDIEKMHGEMRNEIDKVAAGTRLDLNLEKGRIRDELVNQSAETASLTNKLDGEIHALKAHIEKAKFDVIKYCIGTLVSVSAIGTGLMRILISNQ